MYTYINNHCNVSVIPWLFLFITFILAFSLPFGLGFWNYSCFLSILSNVRMGVVVLLFVCQSPEGSINLIFIQRILFVCWIAGRQALEYAGNKNISLLRTVMTKKIQRKFSRMRCRWMELKCIYVMNYEFGIIDIWKTRFYFTESTKC